MRLHYKEVIVGDKIYLRKEKRWYTVQARNDRYIIATKPHFSTVVYTIIDLKEEWMWPDYLVFSNYSYKTREECEEALNDLANNEMEVSQRNWMRLIKPDKIVKSEK